MAEFKDMLKYFRQKSHLSQAELAGIIGVKPSTISMYEVGKRQPDFETEEALADYFNVGLDTLRGKDTEYELNQAQKELLSKFEQLSEEKKNLVLDLIRSLTE